MGRCSKEFLLCGPYIMGTLFSLDDRNYSEYKLNDDQFSMINCSKIIWQPGEELGKSVLKLHDQSKFIVIQSVLEWPAVRSKTKKRVEKPMSFGGITTFYVLFLQHGGIGFKL